MMGLLNTPSGQGESHPKLNKLAPQPLVKPMARDAETSPPSDNAPRVDDSAASLALSPVLSPSPSFGSIRVNKRTTSYGKRVNVSRGSNSNMTTINSVKEQYASIRQRCRQDLGAGVNHYAFDTSHAHLLEWIRNERITRLPHKGGSWDRVLIAAQYFAFQVNRLRDAIESFTPECGAASHLVYGQCLLLLEFGLELSPLLKAEHTLVLVPSIMENIGRAFSELLGIVAGVAIAFYSAVHSGRQSAHLDIYATFSGPIESFRSRVERCAHEMWTSKLRSHGYDDDGHFDLLRKWLAPQDSVLAFLASNRINLTSLPEEYTCTWFQPHLNQFFKNSEKVLVVEGKSGSGKTTLANWVVNRLQRPVFGRELSTLSFFYDPNIAAQATCLAMLKTFLYQLLSLRIGDIGLFNAILQAHADSNTLSTAEDQEDRLWEAFRHALDVVSIGDTDNDGEMLAIIVDGLDEMSGLKPAAKRVATRLNELAHDIPGVRVIQFSQPLELSIGEKIELSLDNISDDIQTIIRQGLSRHPHFVHRDYAEQDSIIDNVVEASDGSMLIAYLCVQYLLIQDTQANLGKAVELLTKSRGTVADHVQRLLATAKLDSHSKAVLSFLITAQRPLSLVEIEQLLRANSTGIDVEETIKLSSILRSLSAFTVGAEGLVAIRHNAVERAILSIPDNSNVSLHLKERHKDFLMRLFASAKRHLRERDSEPRLDLPSHAEVERKIASHRLLEYAVRYWTIHFKLSPLYKIQGDLQLPKEVASVFPTSVTFALLEAGCWKSQSFPHETIELLTIAFRVREALFGPEHPGVLQSAVICAIFYETVLSRHHEAVEWYARAVKIGKVVLGVHSELVITCCNTLLRISETLVSKKRTEIMTYREETLLTLVSSYTYRYGASSKQVLEVYGALVNLYVSISEEKKVSEIQVKIQEIDASQDSRLDEGKSMDRRIDVYLKKHEHGKEIDEFDRLLFGFELEVEETWTIVRVESLLRFAMELIRREQFAEAEEIYLDLWLKLTDYCHTIQVCEWHEKKIEVMLKYSSFLHTHKRIEEASAVLICCWNEYSVHQVSMFESIILLLKEVAVAMKLVGLVSLSLTVSQKCWSWFKSSHKESSTAFKEIEEHIAVTSKEIMKKSTTTTVTTSSEKVIREVFESSFTSEETEITTTTVELSESLTSIYTEQERWSEAIAVIKTTLRKSWPSFFAESIDSITMTSKFSSKSIELATKLAQCYISQKRYEKAEYIYLRLYRVHRKSRRLDDAAVIKYSELYLDFLKKHEMFGLMISFYQELLVEYRSFYGHSHTKTIAILYALGDICRRHHLTHGYWIEYYLEIVTTLNKGALVCHEDAFRALVIVAEHYYETLRYSESLVHFRSIIATFCKIGTKFKYFEDITATQAIFEKYYKAIEETKMETQEHVKLLKEIREACFKYYGESSSISVSVTVVLAEVCSKSEQYEFEAASYYEHILKHSKTVSTTVVKRSKTTLNSIYVKQITSTSTSTSVTKETIEKATTMTYERYEEVRKTHSCSHEITLAHLKDLVTLYHKQQKMEFAIKELRSVVLDCFKSVTSSKELIAVGKTIAAIYTSCGYTSHGLELVREFKLQVIYNTVSKGCSFDVTKVGRSCFAFIASFEYHLRADFSQTIASFMAELLGEYRFYERFVSSIRDKSKTEVVILHASRLRRILFRTRRSDDFDIIERQAVEYFSATEVEVLKQTSKASVAAFIRVLLAHFSGRGQPKDFVASAGHAAVAELKTLLASHKYQAALDLARCTFQFLLVHEGLDDPTEITLGFQLCLMMAGHGEYRQEVAPDAKIREEMLKLSHTILMEVIGICQKSNLSLERCPLAELNELIALVGDQDDRKLLQWLLTKLWDSRERQTSWPSEAMLKLGQRLVQARFSNGDYAVAIKLADDLVYNLRRVQGPRHKQTLEMYALLASLYTSAGQYYHTRAMAMATDKNSSTAETSQRASLIARTYFRKAITTNEEVLKLLIDRNADDSDEDGDDQYSVVGSSNRGSVIGSRSSSRHIDHFVTGTNGTNGENKTASVALNDVQTFMTGKDGSGTAPAQAPEAVLVAAARRHLRLLKLAVQRLGGWGRPTAGHQTLALTTKVWKQFGPELKMKEEEVISSKWKVDGFGGGKAEGGLEEDGFKVPESWEIC
ncbi:hypothetical protein DL766_004901 [Monosporascus sp. MC13-8B]|uniref:Nephrocystin 3-like N-terminal domain-containing protein n=1 Tax=Monosporascus cannonballus TaxID=155416 RepID=A0ABY0HC64_9PEZI|nr:hypothetical protein DL763_010902 [Monosporascus cannonballus]RYO90055.1 hypothetical protein DL762_002900 [Monosporascus cannonballus]RYP30356.1 hypothetical protein DL766_004901 [Monosporascus sp. MC13-8B]